MKVALDLEEVLADTIRHASNSTDKIDVSDFSSWDLDTYTWQVYSGVSDAIWRHDPLSIPPVEPNLDRYTADIYQNVDTLDIVTARTGVDDNIHLWLDHHDISYNTLVSTHTPKCQLDYTDYVDDNPEMVGRCSLLLRDHLHNAGAPSEEVKSTKRIHTLAEAREHLQ